MRRHPVAGSTLVELLIYIAIVAILVFAIVDILFAVFDLKLKLRAMSEVRQGGHIAMERIRLAVQNASSIAVPSSGTSTGILTLVMPTTSTNPTTFSVEDGVLLLKEGTSPTTTLTLEEGQVVYAVFQDMTATGTPGTVRVILYVSSTAEDGPSVFDVGEVYRTTENVRRRP
ncbi:prepilin-type N-terminal cleavage/methylation domain-containing protein [Patescibacteria group bacterium]|nr:prepilin-type N-terminal cleavage/methylation domain-containing protein [Patescibacteria group bacterium]MBU1448324.1 prepilin-type N-terminal cleavage/methylation domain-containing protein [Patescibacteria group bacterium]MBU2612858.1 prepilin-type N-terminal cleavage/methylation domain-containing protein [Patescibacteria group bacterium]